MLKQASQHPGTAQVVKPVDIDPSIANGNNFARGLTILLRHAGCETDYLTVMGDLGEAFILSGTEYDSKLIGGYADLGWWPLDRWHIASRLPFLAWVNGVALSHRDVDFSGVAPDPAAAYARLFQAMVCREINADRALLACWDGCHVITSYDTQSPPLLGWCLFGDKPEQMRMNDYPCAITTYGARSEVMDRAYADMQALSHAVDLGRGMVKYGLWVTGPLAWQGWKENLLRRQTEHFWHGNVKGLLEVARRAAIRYLEVMAARHAVGVAEKLYQAAGIYGKQLEVLESMLTGPEISRPGKEQADLADRINQAAMLDLEAVDSLQAAVGLMAG